MRLKLTSTSAFESSIEFFRNYPGESHFERQQRMRNLPNVD
jgi:hypothetical protein